MTDQNIQQVRSAMRTLLDRAESEPAFKERLQANPNDELRAAGIPDDAIAEFAPRLSGQQSEVSGYVQCRYAETGCGCIGDTSYQWG